MVRPDKRCARDPSSECPEKPEAVHVNDISCSGEADELTERRSVNDAVRTPARLQITLADRDRDVVVVLGEALCKSNRKRNGAADRRGKVKRQENDPKRIRPDGNRTRTPRRGNARRRDWEPHAARAIQRSEALGLFTTFPRVRSAKPRPQRATLR